MTINSNIATAEELVDAMNAIESPEFRQEQSAEVEASLDAVRCKQANEGV